MSDLSGRRYDELSGYFAVFMNVYSGGESLFASWDLSHSLRFIIISLVNNRGWFMRSEGSYE
ncbi:MULTISPECIES: hypothetical protein [unclassified Serratia (in: enterobacteria)]|uniref:hypothetical protein n=1 Tax=unclassified Serratia (in: enterobacteria) TaxID=2647522 RepID=UPI0030764F0E